MANLFYCTAVLCHKFHGIGMMQCLASLRLGFVIHFWPSTTKLCYQVLTIYRHKQTGSIIWIYIWHVYLEPYILLQLFNYSYTCMLRYFVTVVSFTDPVEVVTEDVEIEVEQNAVQFTLEGITVDEV